VAQDDQAQYLAHAIYRDVLSPQVRRTWEQQGPGVAAAHFCWAIKKAQRRAEATLRDLDAPT
jgi:hypothetical protein